VVRTAIGSVLALLTLTSPANEYRETRAQGRTVRELIAELGASDPTARAQAACEIRELGDAAGDAIAPLVAMLGDAAPVATLVCHRSWWRGNPNDLTSPGEQAAAALVAIGSRAFDPVLNALRNTTWAARRNAAWALGAFDDQRAVTALIDALKDREAAVREQVAWALGAIDDNPWSPH
jgi:HEAT repeat protein